MSEFETISVYLCVIWLTETRHNVPAKVLTLENMPTVTRSLLTVHLEMAPQTRSKRAILDGR